MTLLRAALVLVLTFVLLMSPVLVHGFSPPGGGTPAYAAGPLFQDNDNNDNNDNGDNDNAGDSGNDNDDDERGRGSVPTQTTAPTAPTNRLSTVVPAGQSGQLQLGLPGGNVAVRVVPEAPLSRAVTITLEQVNPGLVPPTPGARLDDIVFSISADSGGELPGEVNLAITYSDLFGLNAANLTIGLNDGSRWVEAPKQALAPANNYISASITQTGTYAVYQR